MALALVEAATDQPITWTQVQQQLRLQGLDDDAEFVAGTIIPAVTDRGEMATQRAFLPQTWDYVLDAFPIENYIEIPKPPLISITYVQYVDMLGVTQTWDPSKYLVQAPVGPRCARGRIALPFASVWPIAIPQMGAVTIRFQAGYADVPSLPPLLVAGMLMDAGRLYEYREAIVVDNRAVAIEVPGSSQSIYRSFLSRATQRVRSA